MTRVLSAIVIIAIVFSALWFAPNWVFALLAAAVAAACGSEFAGLASVTGVSVMLTRVFIPLAAAGVCFAIVDPFVRPSTNMSEDLLVLVLALMVLAIVVLVLVSGTPRPAILRWLRPNLFAPVYIGLPLGLLAWLQGVAHGRSLVLWFVFVIAVSDTAQYYCGRAFGRHKLARVISP